MGSRTTRALMALAVLALGLACLAPRAEAGERQRIESLVAIRKNTNTNRVEYGVRLDSTCRPDGDTPIYPYFRWLTRGPNLRRELSWMEKRAYGVKAQKVSRDDKGGAVDFSLRALPGRWMRLEVKKGAEDQCQARVLMKIGGHQAELLDVFLVLTGPVSVDHVEVTGQKLADKSRVTETIEP